MEHRHHRKDRVTRGDPHRVGRDGDHRVKHVGTVRVEHAFGIARSSRGVAHAAGGPLVEGLPFEVAVGFGKPVLVGDDVRQLRLGHVSAVGEDDHLAQGCHGGGDLLDQRHEGQVDEKTLVLGMIHYPGDLLGKQSRIERVVDRSDAHDAVPGLDVSGCVPGQRRDPVAKPEAVALQPLGDLKRPSADFGVGGAHDRTLDRPRHDLTVAVLSRRVVQDLVAQQRPVLHQSEHRTLLPLFLFS